MIPPFLDACFNVCDSFRGLHASYLFDTHTLSRDTHLLMLVVHPWRYSYVCLVFWASAQKKWKFRPRWCSYTLQAILFVKYLGATSNRLWELLRARLSAAQNITGPNLMWWIQQAQTNCCDRRKAEIDYKDDAVSWWSIQQLPSYDFEKFQRWDRAKNLCEK